MPRGKKSEEIKKVPDKPAEKKKIEKLPVDYAVGAGVLQEKINEIIDKL